MGHRRHRHHPDERLLDGPGGAARADQNLALELAPDAIRVNTVALAFVETPAYERYMSPEQAREVLDAGGRLPPARAPRPARRRRRSDRVLASEMAGWITGTVLPIGRGVLAGRGPAVHAETAAAT